MTSAVQTVCGQAYGAKKYAVLGVICQKALILHIIASLILSIFYCFSGTFLRAIQQSADITTIAQTYARGLIPQLLAYAIYLPLQRFLQAQNIITPIAYLSIGVLVVHTGITWIVIHVIEGGVLGAALSLSFSWWLLVVFTGVYIFFSPNCRHTWSSFTMEALSDLWPFFKLTVSSAVMLWYRIKPKPFIWMHELGA